MYNKSTACALSLILSLALLFTMPCLSASAISIILDDGTEKEAPTKGTIHDTDWEYSKAEKTLYMHLGEDPDWSTSGGQVLIPEEIVKQTEHLVVDSNCSSESDTGLLEQWLLGHDFTETAVQLRDVTVNKVGDTENFRAHDGVLFVCHEDFIESGDEAIPTTAATVFVYPQQKTDAEFTLRTDETLIYDGFRFMYYEVIPEYPMCHSLNFNKYLEKMNVESGNIYGYFDENGIVYRRTQYIPGAGGKQLVFCPKTVEGAAPIGSGTESIGHYAFCGCTKLTSAVIPESVRHIGVRAFMDCTSLTSATLSDYTDPEIPDYNTRSVEDQVFYGCTSLKTASVGFGQAVNGFSGCTALESVTLAEGIEEIYPEAFMDCTSLKAVSFPKTLEYIGRSAFENCSSLESVTIGEAVEQVGAKAFMGCLSLKTAEIKSASVACPPVFGENNEYTADYSTAAQELIPGLFADCPSLEEIKVSEANPALYVKDGVLFQRILVDNKEELLKSIDAPQLLHIIGYEAGSDREELDLSGEHELFCLTEYAFNGAKNLKKLVLPDEMTDIRRNSLCRCGLVSMTFPKNVESIADGVLSDCPELTEITFPPHVSFPQYARCGINVPKLRTVTFTADYTTTDYVSPFNGAPEGIGVTWEKKDNGDIDIGVKDGVTVRANRFLKGADGYYNDFLEMAHFNHWKFEDLATGRVIDFSSDKTEKRAIWSVDDETGVIESAVAEEKENRGYYFDVRVKVSDDSSALSGDHVYLVKDGGKETYYSIEMDTSAYLEGARYDGADEREIRIPVTSENAAVKKLDSSGAESDVNAILANGCLIFTEPGSGEQAEDTDTDAKPAPGDTDNTDTDTKPVPEDTDNTDTDPAPKPDDTDTEPVPHDTDSDTGTQDQPEKGGLFGDVDGDGQITSSDALSVLRMSIGLETYSDAVLSSADVDKDGSLTSADALELLRFSIGLADKSSPIGKPITK